jgi:hypothetical protein
VADSKISALTAATAAALANELAINEAGTSKKLTVSLLRDMLGVQKSVLGSDHSVSSTTATEVTDLSQTLVAGTYRFEFFLLCQSATTSVGLTFSVNYTGTATRMVAMLQWPDTGTTATAGNVDDAASGTGGQIVAHSVTRTEATSTTNLSTGTTGVAVVDVDLFLTISGVIVTSDGGDLELWHGSETATATRVEAGSSLVVTRVA